ncbi:MAG: alpha/beta hydrolase family protein [Promethearchaeota archaeon]
MYARHENVRVGKDENGIYFIIKFTNDLTDKVYLDEFFEESIEMGIPLNIFITPYLSPRSRPSGFFDEMQPEEIERIRRELDLKPEYFPTRDDLNVYKNLAKKLQDNPPELTFNAKSKSEYETWAKKVKSIVRELIAYEHEKVDMDVEEGPQTEFNGVLLKKYYFRTGQYLKAPAILARPIKMDEPRPGIICVHGHNKGKINTIGMEPSSSNSYFGIELALRGYVTLSLDQWGWGERAGYNNRREERFEEVFSLSALLLGETAIGNRCWEVSRGIDFLKGFDFVSDKFAVIGHSGGGTTAAFSSVLDDRLDAAVVSGYFCSWKWSIFAIRHCACNHVPRIMKYVDIQDIMAARAPKPTFIVAGDSDGIFPLSGVKHAYEVLKKAYELHSKSSNLEIDIIPRTGHVFRGTYAYPWLDKVLLGK